MEWILTTAKDASVDVVSLLALTDGSLPTRAAGGGPTSARRPTACPRGLLEPGAGKARTLGSEQPRRSNAPGLPTPLAF